MYSTDSFYLSLSFALATFLYYLAVQRRLDYVRKLLSILHVLIQAVPIFLAKERLGRAPYYYNILVAFLIYTLIHTTSILLVERKVVDVASQPFHQRLQTVYRVWSDVRRLPLVDGDTGCGHIPFAMLRGTRVLALWATHHYIVAKLTSIAFRRLRVTITDFAQAKQGLVPLMTQRDLSVRAIVSVRWIWDSYVVLNIAHSLLAVFFVCILRWDKSVEWPTLFGSITEAYSLRRFWGVFWHRLHVAMFAAYTPSPFLSSKGKRQQQPLRKSQLQHYVRCSAAGKILRAFWIFFISAICHITINRVVLRRTNAVQEFRFFLSNYVVCLAETVVERTFRERLCFKGSKWSRLIGYIWVMAVMYCLAPAWQYSLIRANAGH